MRPFTITLQAGAPIDLPIGGELFLVDSESVGPFKAEFFGGNGVQRDQQLAAALPADWALPENGFARIKLTSPSTQTVTFYVANGRTGTNRFSGQVTNTVSVSDVNTDTAVDAGQSFGFYQQIPTAAANLGHFQIKNPLASGKTIYVDALRVFTALDAVRTFTLASYDTDLTTSLAAFAYNKRLGGAAPAARVAHQVNAAPLGTTIGQIQTMHSQEGTQRHISVPAIRLDPGKGLNVIAGAANENHWVWVEWREK